MAVPPIAMVSPEMAQVPQVRVSLNQLMANAAPAAVIEQSHRIV